MWNTLKTKNPQKSKIADFFYFPEKTKKSQKSLDFLKFLARGRQCEVNVLFTFLPKTCDRVQKIGHSLYFGAGAPVIK